MLKSGPRSTFCALLISFAALISLPTSAAVAQVSTSTDPAMQTFGGNWATSRANWTFSRVDGDIVGKAINSATGASAGSLLLETGTASANRLKGIYTDLQNYAYDFELWRTSDPGIVQGFTKYGTGYQIFSAHTLASARDSYAWPSATEARDKLVSTWTIPQGRLTISKSETGIYSGVVRDSTGKVIFLLTTDKWANGKAYDDSTLWKWGTPDMAENALLSVFMATTPDGRGLLAAFPGSYAAASTGGALKFVGTRYGSSAPPPGSFPADATSSAPQSGGTTTQPGSSSSGGIDTPQPPLPQGDGSFRALAKYSVRLDKVVAGKDGRAHVFLTLRNASQQKLYVTSGQLTVRVTDGNGVSKENGQVLQPLPDTVKLFDSTPVLDPEDELKVQYAVVVEKGASPAKVRVSEGDKRVDF